jgi:hypothetical protein
MQISICIYSHITIAESEKMAYELPVMYIRWRKNVVYP